MFVKAVILVAGPQKGTRFRPLSLDVPKPLFPLAGVSMIEHHIEACSSVESLKEILLLGFYPASDLADFVEEMAKKYDIYIRYLQEYTALGTAGGLYHFRDQIRSGDPDAFFVLNGDVCADFPLNDLLNFHGQDPNAAVSVMATDATEEQSLNFGCIVMNKETRAMLHYVEKPETYVSTLVNCGVYVFSLNIFIELQRVFQEKQKLFYSGSDVQGKKEAIWLEKEILTPLAGTGSARVYLTKNWWSQIKTAGSAIYANRNYLKLYERTHPERLAEGPEIIGNVFIHPTASIHPTAVLGPNASIGKNAKISRGARIRESIVLGNSTIGEHSLIAYSVVGWNSQIGDWCRVEGTSNDPNPNAQYAKMENVSLFSSEGKLNPSITILGCNVVIPSEIIILNSIVLPHKQLVRSFKNEIIL